MFALGSARSREREWCGFDAVKAIVADSQLAGGHRSQDSDEEGAPNDLVEAVFMPRMDGLRKSLVEAGHRYDKRHPRRGKCVKIGAVERARFANRMDHGPGQGEECVAIARQFEVVKTAHVLALDSPLLAREHDMNL